MKNLRKSPGKIISGYPGIGKSTLACPEKGVIDLESSNFAVGGVKFTGWEETYCHVAVDLASQGYTVFVSCHASVRLTLYNWQYLSLMPQDIPLYLCYPDVSLKDEWCAKLQERYQQTQLPKDLAALKRALHHYEEDVKLLAAYTPFSHIVITDMDYSLEKLINRI